MVNYVKLLIKNWPIFLLIILAIIIVKPFVINYGFIMQQPTITESINSDGQTIITYNSENIIIITLNKADFSTKISVPPPSSGDGGGGRFVSGGHLSMSSYGLYDSTAKNYPIRQFFSPGTTLNTASLQGHTLRLLDNEETSLFDFKIPAKIITNQPMLPPKPTISNFFSAIKEWISGLWAKLAGLTVVGESNPALGSVQTYNIQLTAPTIIDSDFTDGTVSVRYCDAALVRNDGTIISESGFESCANSYSKSFTATIQKTLGKYAVIGIMTESKGIFNTDTLTWSFSDYQIIAQDALDFSTKASLPGAQTPIAPTNSIFSKLLSWMKNLFKF